MSIIRKLSLPSMPLPEWEPQGNVQLFTALNSNQVLYKGRSKVNRTRAAAPIVLAPLMYDALGRLEEKVGDIDAWAAGMLGWTIPQLGARLTSEQVDGVALGIMSMMGNREEGGFLVSDVTGFGKGRIAAALSVAAIRMGRRVVFFTEKAQLFSDFWRDVRAIGGEDTLGSPFMLNAGSRILDTTSSDGKVLFPPHKKSYVDSVLRDGLPPENRFVMSTYSQVNRKGRKTEFIDGIAPGSHFMLDEAQNQSGDSAMGRNLAVTLELCRSSTYATATAGRELSGLASYRTVFPWIASLGELDAMTPGQRRAFAEMSVKEACRMGRIVRREHDLTNMVIKVMSDLDSLPHNKRMSNDLAPVLSRMARLSNRVYATLEARNEASKETCAGLPPGQRRAKSEYWFSANFGSRLRNLIGQFKVALKVDMCVEACISDLLKGIKPVVVIESTMESLMRELNKPPEDGACEPADQDREDDEVEEVLDEVEGEPPAPPTYGQALRVMAERLLRVGVKRGGFEAEKEVVELDDPTMLALRDEIIALAHEFPELSLSPIDDIRERVEARGRELYEQGVIPEPWVMDEVSARSMRVVNGRYVSMGKRDRTVSVARFVNGQTHGMVITNAAAVGLSLHDGEDHLHHAQRSMYLLGAPLNPVQFMQILGRVFRRGQLTEPYFYMLSTGLDAETFDMAVQNRKMENLSASVTGSASTNVLVAARDYEDAIGNDIAYDLLMENPGLADAMGISLRVPKEEGDRSLFWIGKLLRRLWCVDDAAKNFLYGNMVRSYEERFRAGGAARLHGTVLDGEWMPASRRLLETGDGSDNPLTGGNVYVTDIVRTRVADPISSTEAAWMVAEARQTFDERLQGLPERLHAEAPAMMASLLGRRWKTVNKALSDEGENPIKRMKSTATALLFAANKLRPGMSAVMPGEDGDPFKALVIDVRFPASGGDLFSPRQWAVSYAVPGEDELRVATLDVLLRDERYPMSRLDEGQELMSSFDGFPRGQATETRRTLDGSSLGALLASVRMGSGSKVAYADKWGQVHDAVLLPRSAAHKVATIPGIASTPEAVMAVIRSGNDARLQSNLSDPQGGIELRAWTEGRIRVIVPAAKKHVRMHDLLLDVVGEWTDYAQQREAGLTADKVPALMNALRVGGIPLYYDASHRMDVMKAMGGVDMTPVADAVSAGVAPASRWR